MTIAPTPRHNGHGVNGDGSGKSLAAVWARIAEALRAIELLEAWLDKYPTGITRSEHEWVGARLDALKAELAAITEQAKNLESPPGAGRY
jgi:hypothetical protein